MAVSLPSFLPTRSVFLRRVGFSASAHATGGASRGWKDNFPAVNEPCGSASSSLSRGGVRAVVRAVSTVCRSLKDVVSWTEWNVTLVYEMDFGIFRLPCNEKLGLDEHLADVRTLNFVYNSSSETVSLE
ncbi:hypothetical protein MLD38_015885 [Melastoma candidum]|uniref:Uncharacterized protein n=1 Tax=Melastoma candidum TaxID=119954 RepID=A0ACB9RHH5_9MYRT|nr:hypothetical protein MLD38_015885 [Melastoma candidum]